VTAIASKVLPFCLRGNSSTRGRLTTSHRSSSLFAVEAVKKVNAPKKIVDALPQGHREPFKSVRAPPNQ
jgi:hypothetical protein